MKMYKLDKTAFSINSFSEASNRKEYWLQQSAADRLKAAWYLTIKANQLDLSLPQKMDKSQFEIRQRD